MEIRCFRESDRSAIIELWQLCGLTRPWNDSDRDISRKLNVQPELFFVGEIDGSIVATAMAGYDGHRGSVFYLAVSPEYQRAGLGRQMMLEIERSLEGMGCPKLNILVRSSNAEVMKFYNRLGYVTDDVVNVGKRLIPDT